MISVAKGTALKISNTAVAHLTKIGSPSIKRDTTEVTTLDNSTGFKEFLATFAEGGDVGISGYFDFSDAGQKAIIEANKSGDEVECEIVFPATIGASWKFKGIVTELSTNAETAGAVEVETTIKVTGAPTLAASSAG